MTMLSNFVFPRHEIRPESIRIAVINVVRISRSTHTHSYYVRILKLIRIIMSHHRRREQQSFYDIIVRVRT